VRELTNSFYIHTLLFADDQIVIADNEDDLQRSTYRLNEITKQRNMKYTFVKHRSFILKENIVEVLKC